MKKDKIKNLEKKGWKVGNVSEFLNLSRDEEESIKTKLALRDPLLLSGHKRQKEEGQ